ncbi:MAG: carboxymuconolactone decarboxylase family protein [Candidatus Ranarchaeia archaeon]
MLKAVWGLRQAVMQDGLIERKTKEMIALAVAIANNCEYCIWAHTDELKKIGVKQDEILELISIVSLLNSFNAIFNGTQLKYV